MRKNSFATFFTSFIAILLAYYVSIILHEWGHGSVAWLLGQKTSPFDVYYGGWALLHVDENVNYAQLIATQHGIFAALIGIGGFTVSLIFAAVCFILLSNCYIQKSTTLFSIVYWFLIINMIPLFQYIPLTTFSSEGDIGQFIHGLNISPWLVFIPGTAIVITALWRIFSLEVIKAYAFIPIRTINGQRFFLLVTLGILFLLIYTHGYNPITDKGTNLFSKLLAMLAILLVPIIYAVCNPSHKWVREAIDRMH